MADQNTMISRLREEISQLQEKQEKLDKQVTTQTKKLKRSKELYKSVDYCISNFLKLTEQIVYLLPIQLIMMPMHPALF